MSQQQSRDFTAKEIVPGTFDVHFNKPGSASLVADVLEQCFGQKWVPKGHRSMLRSLRWVREDGSGSAAVDSIHLRADNFIVDEKESAAIHLRVGLCESDGGVNLATVRIFVHEFPSELINEFVGDRSVEDNIAMALVRKRFRSGEVCPDCLRPVTDCDCCDADVNPETEAQG